MFHDQALLALPTEGTAANVRGVSVAKWKQAHKTREEPQEFLKAAGRQPWRWEDMAESITLSIPQFHSRSRTVMWGWIPDASALTNCSFGMSPLQVPASQFFPDASSPCFARFPGEHMRAPLSETATRRKPVGGHTASPQSVYLLARTALTKYHKLGTLNNRNVPSHQFCNADWKNAQPQSQELCFIWWARGRHQTWDATSQIALRDCTKEEGEEPEYRGFSGGTDGKEPACQQRRHKRCGFNPWVGKMPWRRTWQPTPGFLPGKSHGQRSLVNYHP